MRTNVVLSIPSPPISGFELGPITIRFYALCLIAGIFVAWVMGVRRWRARGGRQEDFETIMLWTIPIGILGARLYHVLTHLQDYVGPDAPGRWWAIWEGGIAIYGAIGGGALAALIVARRCGVRFGVLGDSLAPAIAVGQAIGRWGNWFNQELYGSPTDLPWGLEIAPAYRAAGFEQYETFHPTFLYESVWNVGVAVILLWVDRRFAMGRGKLLALYVALYAFGRFFTEGIRLDFSYDTFGPIRFNQAMAGLFFLAALAVLGWMLKYRPGRDADVRLHPEVVGVDSPESSEASGAADPDLTAASPDAEDGQVAPTEPETASPTGTPKPANGPDEV